MGQADWQKSYNIEHWGQGYFAIDAKGQLQVRPCDAKPEATGHLPALVEQLKDAGVRLPVLVRFNDILQSQVQRLQQSFAAAMSQQNYAGGYTPIYPIKVNQQRVVVESLLEAGDAGIGLEAGSKPELLAVLAMAKPKMKIVCNGYKDEEYIRLALLARQMGFESYIVIEKLTELETILRVAAQLGIPPLLGVRVRLTSIGVGKWQNSGGQKAKFGLTAHQMLALVQRLKQDDQLDALQLLHFHLGSQIPNIQDIQRGLREAACFYGELWRLGAEIQVVDVGGGLGIDYQGTRSRDFCSMNYSLAEYARNVVAALVAICQERDLPTPHVLTESGRAMTAHHAVLLTDTIAIESPQFDPNIEASTGNEPTAIEHLWQTYQNIGQGSVLESHHDLSYYLEQAQTAFSTGTLTLQERARAEQIYGAGCYKVRDLLDAYYRPHRALLDELNENLADKLFTNLSIFQSLPDVWAIDQVFPVLPIAGLDQPMTRRAVIEDLTCDSDGRIDHYVEGDGIEATLMLPPPNQDGRYLLAVFLAGAYQETLGDIHNLFGDTDAVLVHLDEKGQWQIAEKQQGDQASDVLRYVGYQADDLMGAYAKRLSGSSLSEEEKENCLACLEESLSGYTYLEGESK